MSLGSKVFSILAVLLFVLVAPGYAASSGDGHGHAFALTFFWIAVILIVAKLSSLVEKIGQPAVLGELVVGVLLGNLFLFGINTFVPIVSNETILFLAELGVVILLFQIGLESNIKELTGVGFRAFLVAIIGVVAPFVLGAFLVGPLMLPGLDPNAYLFLGAALTATSVGITARVFKDLGRLKSSEAKMVLGAAVFDDVMGLIILAIVSSIAVNGGITLDSLALISMKSIAFLVGAILVGQLMATPLGMLFASIQAGVGMKFTLAIAFCLSFAFAAEMLGLAPIIGAFAAGLILDPVHFRYFKDPSVVADVRNAVQDAPHEIQQKVNFAIENHARRHIEDLIEPLSFLLVPLFFVVTGMQVNLASLFDAEIISAALGLTVAAIVGKYVAGLLSGPGVSKSIVGFGLVPRGEVGLIFASIGLGLGVISEEVFSVIIVMVIITTLATPPILASLLKKQSRIEAQRMGVKQPVS